MRNKRLLLVYRELWDNLKGQSMIESTFGMIVIVMLVLSMIKVFYWVGDDLASRRAAHEESLTSPVAAGTEDDNYRQIRPFFYEGTPMDATTINSEIFGSNRLR